MSFDPKEQHRRSTRLAGYDYRESGAYFVTVCAAHKRPVFGHIENGAMRCNPYGSIVIEEWARTETLRANVVLDEFVVMPNHFHAIVIFKHNGDTNVGAQRAAPLQGATPNNVAAQSLGAVVCAFKSAVTRRINAHRSERGLAPVVVWQRNYYERIIRDETELNQTRRYIFENPQNWDTDAEHP